MLAHLDSDILSSLTQGELTVLRYIDSHQEELLTQSIQDLAAKAYTSTATILRLCHKMGYQGFSELKYVVKSQLAAKNLSEPSRTTTETLAQELYLNIENTARFIDTKAVEKIVTCLLSDKKIHIYGSGLTSMSMEYMQRFLLSAGRSCIYYHSSPLAYRAAGKMSHRDFLLIASASGATPSVMRIAQIAKNGGAVLAAISNLDNNPLSQQADINLYTFITNRDYYGTDIRSRIPCFYLADIILECYLCRLNSPHMEILT